MTLALPHTPAPPAPPPVIFSRRRKAAIIVRLLLSEGASLPLDTLPDDLQAALTAEIAAMRYIDGETLRAVVGEFLTEMERVGLTFPGGVDGALSLLDGHISETAAAGLRAASGGHPADPWKTIAALETETLIPMVQAESTEVAAVLLSKLATVKAAEILGKLPGAQARRIACAISLTGQVGPETVARIGQTLVEQIASAPQPAFDTPAAARIGAILNVSPAATRDDLLAGLEESDAAFAETVRKAIFTFQDIPARIAPRDIPAVTRSVPEAALVTALAAALTTDAEVAEFILGNMSKRLADQLRERAGEIGPVRPKEADAAMGEVVMAIRALQETGEITLILPDEDP
ncbi:MAG: FliG C-terminal domain-containing protein [Pseudomonadota bacterium]|nr:FliG C-terminal domain-containing protein [Pseudomonadota bacterium]